MIGTNATLLWFLLPAAILLAGVAPAAISFAAGQAAFTLTLVFLFNIIQPTGWRVGLLRVEDIALGCGVSLVVGLLFWPRGAGAALRKALADAYTTSADYLASAVDYGTLRCEAQAASLDAPVEDANRAAAAARRLDDTFRSYLIERGAKPLALAESPAWSPVSAGCDSRPTPFWTCGSARMAPQRAIARRPVRSCCAPASSWSTGTTSSPEISSRDRSRHSPSPTTGPPPGD